MVWQFHFSPPLSSNSLWSGVFPLYIVPQSEAMCKKRQQDTNDRWATRTAYTAIVVQHKKRAPDGLMLSNWRIGAACASTAVPHPSFLKIRQKSVII